MARRFADRFVLEREIGAGGMARVYLGTDEVLDRPVAVKILEPAYGGTEIGDRFRREGRTAARLSHPNIVQVYDAGEGEFEGREASYIVMEYVPGGDLKALIDGKGSLEDEELARLGVGVSSGLAHAHGRGIVHRDIKPHNILLDAAGQPKLTDFGIARALDASHATRSGSYLGTALYSSPEQLRGERVTPKSDIYSLGVTLYQAVTGRAPFSGTPIEVASQHLSQTPPTPSSLGAPTGGALEALIFDCIAKDPDRRPTAEEAHERLEEVARPSQTPAPPPVSATAPVGTENVRSSAPEPGGAAGGAPPGGARGGGGRRRRGPVLLAAAVLLLIILGLAAVYAVLGGGEDQTAQVSGEQQENPPEEQGSGPAGGGETTAAPEEQAQTAPEETVPETTSGAGGAEDGAEEAAAEQAVEDFYASAADEDYETASDLLTASWRRNTFPSQGAFVGTFDTLERIEFTEGPEAQVSGNTATVTGETLAEHSDRTERNSGTWRLVNDGGEWLIDGWDVSTVSRVPA